MIFTLDRETKKLLSWPEFEAGLRRMNEIVVNKEKVGDFSPTEYRIELTPPHRWYGENFIVLTHNPKHNRSVPLSRKSSS